MGRLYCGILGLIAFVTICARGWIHREETLSIMWAGWLAMIAFAAVGLIIGWIAGRTIEDSVNTFIAEELAAHQAALAAQAKELEGRVE